MAWRPLALAGAVLVLAGMTGMSAGEPAGAQPPAEPWEIVDLGTLGGTYASAHAVNDKGQIVGESDIAGDAAYHAFLWQNGTFTDLGTLGGTNSTAWGVNDAGQVVGGSDTSGDAAYHAFLWENGKMTDLGTLGGSGSAAWGINDGGRVVGGSDIAGDVALHAFVWQGGTMSDIGGLGGKLRSAAAINDTGLVVGWSDTIGVSRHAFSWRKGVFTDIGTLGGTDSYAIAVNERGQIAGDSQTAGDVADHAFVWTNGKMTDLGTLGGSDSEAHSINEAGQVAGRSSLPGVNYLHAFLWENGTMADLGTLGGTSSSAWGINDTGLVVGSSRLAGHGGSHAVLWEQPFYVMVDEIGTVYAFPGDRHVGNAPIAAGASAVDIVINPRGTGYYVLDDTGVVHPIGPNTANHGNLDLAALRPGEHPSAMSLTETGNGYWIFTNLGGAVPFGDAPEIGDVSDLPLVGEIVDAAPYPPGFYMVGADGGVFTPPAFLGSPAVPFFGSVYDKIGPIPLNQPIVTIYVDATDHRGYSLAAGDGGMFNFESEFCGSIPGVLPGVTLNRPIVNAVPYGDCYIFFAADGGAFVFGDKPFLGSLGNNPPAHDIVSGDAHAT